jgi:hypothetical protein
MKADGTPETRTGVDAKAIATLQAKAALAGYSLVAMPGGGFVASRWGFVRVLAKPADVEAFLARVGAAP